MLIAFEGPTNVGKSYGADKISGGNTIHHIAETDYTKAQQVAATEKGLIQCFDQVGWITHMVHRLALPDHTKGWQGWPVFAMPDTHLVFKVHTRDSLSRKDDEKQALVNSTYLHQALSLIALNEDRDYALFKTITVVGVSDVATLTSALSLRVLEFSSPLHPWWGSARTKLVHDDLSLLDMLAVEEANR